MSIYYRLENVISRWGTPGIGFPGRYCNARGKSLLRAGVCSLEGARLGGCRPLSRWQGGPRARLSLCLHSWPRQSGAVREHKAKAAPATIPKQKQALAEPPLPRSLPRQMLLKCRTAGTKELPGHRLLPSPALGTSPSPSPRRGCPGDWR